MIKIVIKSFIINQKTSFNNLKYIITFKEMTSLLFLVILLGLVTERENVNGQNTKSITYYHIFA